MRPGAGLVVVASILIGVLVIAGTVLAWRNRGVERRRVTGETALVSRAAAAETDRFLQDRLALLAALAASPRLQSGDPAQIQELFAGLPSADQSLANVAWANLAGDVLARTPPQLPAPINVADREHVRAVLSTGRPFVSSGLSMPRNPDVKGPVVILAAPTRDATGAVNGVIANTITLERLEQTLTRFNANPDAALLVIDRSNQLILNTEGDESLQDLGGSAIVHRARTAGARVETDVTGPRGNSGRLVAYSAVPSGDWILFVTRPTSVAFAPAQHTFLVTIAAVLAAALAACDEVASAIGLSFGAFQR
jgi:hypothetical protein